MNGFEFDVAMSVLRLGRCSEGDVYQVVGPENPWASPSFAKVYATLEGLATRGVLAVESLSPTRCPDTGRRLPSRFWTITGRGRCDLDAHAARPRRRRTFFGVPIGA